MLQRKQVLESLQEKNTLATEAFDVQALPALEHGVASYWYPQYLATVVIAVDRDRAAANISGWNDLFAEEEAVGIAGSCLNQMVFSAVAYGLEGEDYTLLGAANALGKMRKAGLLRPGSLEPALVICYDFQVAAMIRDGRNIEIVVPVEGTFSYERGLLSNTELSFAGDVDALLVSAVVLLRLPERPTVWGQNTSIMYVIECANYCRIV